MAHGSFPANRDGTSMIPTWLRRGCRRATLALISSVAAAQAPSRTLTPATPVQPAVFQLLHAFTIVAQRDLWPGFTPATTPLAIYDGTRTWLIRHPSPPNEFRPYYGRRDVEVMDGRQAEVTANSSAAIGGRQTATLVPEFTRRAPARWAPVLAHEAFHAYQRAHHSTWAANEADLFTYPWENVDALAGRRLEFEGMRRALAARRVTDVACWSRVILDERAERFARLGASAATYERGTELNEGLAQYIESRAGNKSALELLPAAEFAPDLVRDRGYRSGAALGQLLDRLWPAWRDALEHGDSTLTLDAMLTQSLARRPAVAPACAFTDAERTAALQTARADSAGVAQRLATEERDFLGRPGWRITVDAGDRPLGIAGFDPINVSRVSASRIIHHRYLKLKSTDGELEVNGHEIATDGAGAHPLFNGVRVVTVSGLSVPPAITDSSGVMLVRGVGIEMRFPGARADTSGQAITIHPAVKR